MENKDEKKAYKEVLEILKGLNLIEKIPKDIIDMFEENKDENWHFEFDKNTDLEEQKILKETIKLLSVLYITYICKDKEEQNELLKIYEETQKNKSKEYTDNLFKNTKQQKIEEPNNLNYTNKEPDNDKKMISKTEKNHIIIKIIGKIKETIKTLFKN